MWCSMFSSGIIVQGKCSCYFSCFFFLCFLKWNLSYRLFSFSFFFFVSYCLWFCWRKVLMFSSYIVLFISEIWVTPFFLFFFFVILFLWYCSRKVLMFSSYIILFISEIWLTDFFGSFVFYFVLWFCCFLDYIPMLFDTFSSLFFHFVQLRMDFILKHLYFYARK